MDEGEDPHGALCGSILTARAAPAHRPGRGVPDGRFTTILQRQQSTSGQGMMTMVKGGTELLQDPVTQELLASQDPGAAGLQLDRRHPTGGVHLVSLEWQRHRDGHAARCAQAQGPAER